VISIAIDGEGNKWLGTQFGGVAKYDGTDWTVYNPSNSGLPNNDVRSIAIDNEGNKWFGTDGGVAMLMEGATSVSESNYKKEYNLRAYPNPFSNSTVIKYTIEKTASVRINIYNTLGNKISTITNEFKEAGEHQAIFNAEYYSAGMYYYTIQIGERVKCGKMMLVR
jgi:hypothetical protein